MDVVECIECNRIDRPRFGRASRVAREPRVATARRRAACDNVLRVIPKSQGPALPSPGSQNLARLSQLVANDSAVRSSAGVMIDAASHEVSVDGFGVLVVEQPEREASSAASNYASNWMSVSPRMSPGMSPGVSPVFVTSAPHTPRHTVTVRNCFITRAVILTRY